MALKHLDRLHDVQETIINKTEDQLNQLLKYKQDYIALRERLVSLAHRITYDVMVPFGSVAFMPGKLVHTNEIRVYLGDGWFVDRSTKQAIEIIDRRIKSINDDISEFQKQKDLLKPRLDFTKEFKDEGREAFEITEECSEEELAAWKAKHWQKVKQYRRDQLEAKKVAMTQDEEDVYWQRMDEAERVGAQSSLWSVKEEEELGPDTLQSHSGSSRVEPRSDDFRIYADSRGSVIHPSVSPPGNSARKSAGKTVRWKDVFQEESEKDEEVEDSSDDSEEYVELCRPTTINFVHTPSSNAVQKSSPTKDGVRQILSPADIGPSFISNAPKSILKKRSSIEEGKMENALKISDPSKEMSSLQLKVLPSNPLVKEADLPTTFASSSLSSSSSSQFALDATVANRDVIRVVEKNIDSCNSPVHQETETSGCTCERDETVSNDQTDKRVSKFKATRLKKTSAVK